MDDHQPVDSCQVTWCDVPRVFASCTVYVSCFGFGAGMAALGAAVTTLSIALDRHDTALGTLFIFRGLGFLVGVLASIYYLKRYRTGDQQIAKHLLCGGLIIIAGAVLFTIPLVAAQAEHDGEYMTAWNAGIMCTINSFFFMQGICFGGIDAFTALAISEMWGQRAPPWMQAKNFASNLGALIGPFLIESYGYECGFRVIGLVGLLSLLGPLCTTLYMKMHPSLGLPAPDSTLQCPEIAILSETLDVLQEESKSEDPLSPINSAEEWKELVVTVLEEVQFSRSRSGTPRQPSVEATFSGSKFSFDIDRPSPRKRSRLNSLDSWHSASARSLSVGLEPLHERTLSFASPALARKVRRAPHPTGIVFVPTAARVLLAAMVFWQLGLLCAFGGWVSTYASSWPAAYHRGSDGTDALGASMLTALYTAQIVGSGLAVPATVLFSASVLIRCQLVLSMLAAGLLALPLSLLGSVQAAANVTGAAGVLLGGALGCMYPLVLTVANDYGTTMTTDSTMAVVLGGCLGEAIAPFLVSLAMGRYGPVAFQLCMCVMVVALVVTYLALHIFLRHSDAVRYEDKVQQMLERQASPTRMLPLRTFSPSSGSTPSPHRQPISETSPLIFEGGARSGSPNSSTMSGEPHPFALQLPSQRGSKVKGIAYHTESGAASPTSARAVVPPPQMSTPRSLYARSFGVAPSDFTKLDNT